MLNDSGKSLETIQVPEKKLHLLAYWGSLQWVKERKERLMRDRGRERKKKRKRGRERKNRKRRRRRSNAIF